MRVANLPANVTLNSMKVPQALKFASRLTSEINECVLVMSSINFRATQIIVNFIAKYDTWSATL